VKCEVKNSEPICQLITHILLIEFYNQDITTMITHVKQKWVEICKKKISIKCEKMNPFCNQSISRQAWQKLLQSVSNFNSAEHY
jgi:hypothetical protein